MELTKTQRDILHDLFNGIFTKKNYPNSDEDIKVLEDQGLVLRGRYTVNTVKAEKVLRSKNIICRLIQIAIDRGAACCGKNCRGDKGALGESGIRLGDLP